MSGAAMVQQKQAVVVGAGPAGSVVAAGLASRGWKVHVFEKRGNMADPPSPSVRARGYPMSLSQKSVRAIEQAGLEIDSVGPRSNPQRGSYANGLLFPRMAAPDNVSFLIDRLSLGRELHLAARDKIYPNGSIDWHWNTSLEDVDLNRKVATFVDSADVSAPGTTTRTAVQYDLLVGADGSYSAVRKAMLKQVPGFTAEEVLVAQSTYKTFHGLKVTPEVEAWYPGIKDQKPREYLNSWRKPGLPAVVGWLTQEGTLSGMVVGDVYDEAKLHAGLSESLKGAPQEWIDSITQQVKEGGPQPPANFGQIVQLSQFHGPSCVLVGDAAHPVTSTLGNGCNLALDSVRVFLDTLDKAGPDAVPQAFTRARMPDVKAFQHMELHQVFTASAAEHVIRGVKRKATAVEHACGLLLMRLSAMPFMLLHKLLPSVFKSRILYVDMILSGDKTFSQALAAARASAATVVLTACAAVTGVVSLLLKALPLVKSAVGI